MRSALSPTTLRRLDIQGFDRVPVSQLADVAPWLRVTFGLCAVLAVAGTALASPVVLLLLAPLALAGAVSPVHPFDRLYNHGLRRLTGTPRLPRRGAPSRFACGLGAAWLVATAWAFQSGATAAGYLLGGALGAIAALVSTTDICIPSMLFRTFCGWPPARGGGQTEAVS
jgi:hypothetical protein